MAEVVNLYDKRRTEEPAPAQSEVVVQEIERLLQAAKAGDIVGFAGTCMHADHAVTYSFAGRIGGYSVLGALTCLTERIRQVIMNRD